MKNCCLYKKNLVLAVAATALIAFLTTSCTTDTIQTIQKVLPSANKNATKLFGYNPEIEVIPTDDRCNDTITITAHGYGGNRDIGYHVAQYARVSGHVITFNLPDHDYTQGIMDPTTLTHGSPSEIMPLIFVLKTVVGAGAEAVNLYGFSAGGGAVINALAMLNTNQFDNQLARIGITKDDKTQILNALSHGVVLLDTPLKSIEEIIALRGFDDALGLLEMQYKKNDMRPIDSVKKLAGLCLNVILYFERDDEILYNRDDALFIERLQTANACGTTHVVYGDNGGHLGWHTQLWESYQALKHSLVPSVNMP